MRKLPPYSKPLFEILLRGEETSNSINIFVGEKAWPKAKAFSVSYPDFTICLPPYHCPSLYSWPVNHCECIIIDTGYCEEDYVNDIASILYEHGAEKVMFVAPDYAIIKYEKDL